MKNEIIIGILWLVYGIIHSLLASEFMKKIFVTKYYRLIYNLIAVILLVLILYLLIVTKSARLIPSSFFNQLLGGIMMLSGICVMYISIKGYASKEFLGTDFNSTKLPTLKTDDLSAFVRHPLYMGTLLFMWGIFGFFATESCLISVLILTIYIRIGMYFEEKKLVKLFGKQYEEYQKNVPMLIPKL